MTEILVSLPLHARRVHGVLPKGAPQFLERKGQRHGCLCPPPCGRMEPNETAVFGYVPPCNPTFRRAQGDPGSAGWRDSAPVRWRPTSVNRYPPPG